MTTPDRDARTILVTGATGFTGGALAIELRRRGHVVRALVRRGSATDRLERSGVELVYGDLRRREDVNRAVAGVSLIYHIAAVFRTAGHPDAYYHDVNVGGTANVLEAAAREGVSRTVCCSTAGVHGHVSRIPADESAPFNAGDIYQVTKLEAEKVAARACADGLPGVIFRPVGIYGPHDLRFLKLFRAIRRRRFAMFGSGEVLYHLTYIDDLVAGIILCGEHPAALGETFILAGGEYTSLNRLVEVIAGAVGVRPPRVRLPLWPLRVGAELCERVCVPLGVDPPLHHRRVDFFVKSRAFTSEKARRLLGYAPGVPLEDGVARTARWYGAQGLL
jgi:dihydroflavonol-4-reductase